MDSGFVRTSDAATNSRLELRIPADMIVKAIERLSFHRFRTGPRNRSWVHQSFEFMETSVSVMRAETAFAPKGRIDGDGRAGWKVAATAIHRG